MDAAFDLVVQVKYSQTVQLKGTRCCSWMGGIEKSVQDVRVQKVGAADYLLCSMHRRCTGMQQLPASV